MIDVAIVLFGETHTLRLGKSESYSSDEVHLDERCRLTAFAAHGRDDV